MARKPRTIADILFVPVLVCAIIGGLYLISQVARTSHALYLDESTR